MATYYTEHARKMKSKADYPGGERKRSTKVCQAPKFPIIPKRALKRLPSNKIKPSALESESKTNQIKRLSIGLQNIFSRQLPQMPRKYIRSLMSEPDHESLVLIQKGCPIGGICFRNFPRQLQNQSQLISQPQPQPLESQDFVEIVFCAVTSEKQVTGYGTCMMNVLKDLCIKRGILNFLTYADHCAQKYFWKQGFRKTITLKKRSYNGLIKEYDGASLTHCSLNPSRKYTNSEAKNRLQMEKMTFSLIRCSQKKSWKSKSIEFIRGSKRKFSQAS